MISRNSHPLLFAVALLTTAGFVIPANAQDCLKAGCPAGQRAEHKINQVYHHCEILECQEVTPTLKKEGLDLEDVISLINKQEEK